jgi:hypothetical protein
LIVCDSRLQGGQAEPGHDRCQGQVRAAATAPTVGGNFHRGEMRCPPTLEVFLKQSTNKMKILQNFTKGGLSDLFLNARGF